MCFLLSFSIVRLKAAMILQTDYIFFTKQQKTVSNKMVSKSFFSHSVCSGKKMREKTLPTQVVSSLDGFVASIRNEK